MPTWLIVAIVAGPIPVALIGGYLTTPKSAWKAKRPWHEKKD